MKQVTSQQPADINICVTQDQLKSLLVYTEWTMTYTNTRTHARTRRHTYLFVDNCTQNTVVTVFVHMFFLHIHSFDYLKAVTIKIFLFWDMTPCSVLETYQSMFNRLFSHTQQVIFRTLSWRQISAPENSRLQATDKNYKRQGCVF